jgi:hypothetical protein
MRTHLASVLLIGGLAGVAAAQPATGIVPPVFQPVSNDPAGAPAAQVVPAIYVAPVVPPAFRLLAEPAVQADIGLTAEQKAAADKVREGWAVPARGVSLGRFGFVPGDVLRAAANQWTADFVATGLTKEQRTRLDQILFQLREKEFGRHQAFAMAARDLGLRPDQVEDVQNVKAVRVEEIEKAVTSGKRFEKLKGEVETANGDTFEKMAEMLTRAQRERLKGLRGKPFMVPPEELKLASPVPDPPPAQYSATNVGYYDLELLYITAPALVTELKLDEAQVKALSAAWNEAVGDFGVVQGRLPRGWVDIVHAQTEKVLDKQLTKEERVRFDQIMMQRRAKVSPEAACTYPAAIASLKLTPIQLQQLTGGKRLNEVLTKDQLSGYDKLLGAPFKLPTVKDDYIPAPRTAPAPAGTPPVPSAVARDFLRLTDRLKLSDEQVKTLRDLAEDEPKIRELIRKELALDDTPPLAGAGRAQTTVNVVTERYRSAVERQCWDVLDEPQRSIARKIFGRGRN